MKVQDLIDQMNATGTSKVSLWDPEIHPSFNALVSFNPILIKSKSLLKREAAEKKVKKKAPTRKKK